MCPVLHHKPNHFFSNSESVSLLYLFAWFPNHLNFEYLLLSSPHFTNRRMQECQSGGRFWTPDRLQRRVFIFYLGQLALNLSLWSQFMLV